MFRKYPSIISETDVIRFDKFVNKFPTLETDLFIATEKLHGANIQIYADKNGFKTYSRTQEITNYNFCNSTDVVDKIKGESWFYELLDYVKSTAPDWSFRLYGELHGRGIQKGVEYGTRNILFFDLVVNELFLPFSDFQALVPTFRKVPTLDKLTFKQIKNYVFNKNSLIIETKGVNIAEGAVIKPYAKDYFIGESRFILKRRNDSFFEKVVERGTKAFDKSYLNEYFKDYITEQRAFNLLSKEGFPTNYPEFTSMLPKFVADAKADFYADYMNELNELHKDELKLIFNVGNLPLCVLKKACLELNITLDK